MIKDMGLKKYKLGELVELVEETNALGKYGPRGGNGYLRTGIYRKA